MSIKIFCTIQYNKCQILFDPELVNFHAVLTCRTLA